jgi:hypothetical protein
VTAQVLIQTDYVQGMASINHGKLKGSYVAVSASRQPESAEPTLRLRYPGIAGEFTGNTEAILAEAGCVHHRSTHCSYVLFFTHEYVLWHA